MNQQHQLEVACLVGRVGDLSDGQLLGRGLDGGEVVAHAAFTALVERHGPMVLRVCRLALGDAHDADDAFQATFLVLARRAGSIRRAESVASWLHGVALKVAARTRMANARRADLERRAGMLRATRADGTGSAAEATADLHAAIARLAAPYREALILCYFEGLTTDEAAARLGCARGTVLSRLARGRERLRARLARGGLVPLAGPALEAHLVAGTPARVAPALAEVTARAASVILTGAVPASVVGPAVAQLTTGVVRMLFWTKLKTVTLAMAGIAALAVGARAGLPPRSLVPFSSPLPPARQVAPPDAPSARPAPVPPGRGRAVVITGLPPHAELHQLLRRAAAEAIELTRQQPASTSWTLTTIAGAQARAGDLAGARETFEVAVREAGGGNGGKSSAWNLWRVGHFQAEAGLNEEARATLWQALAALPESAAVEPEQDGRSIGTYSVIAKEQARIGFPAEARATADRLVRFATEFLERTKEPTARASNAPEVAAGLAAAGDYDGAFRWAEGVGVPGNVLGPIALAAAQSLDRTRARPFVTEAAVRLGQLKTVEETYQGLSDLAEAQALIGEIEAARRSARAIGVGETRVDYDMTDGQPYALFRVARVQQKSGDRAGAAATLRDGFESVRDQPKMRGADGRFGQILLGQILVGDVADTLRSVESIRTDRASSLAQVARLQAAGGDDNAATATFDRSVAEAIAAVPRPDARPARPPGARFDPAGRARMTLAEVRAMAGDVAGALEVFRSLEDPPFRPSALGKIVAARATAGDVAGALRLALDESRSPAERRMGLQGLGEGVTARLTSPALDSARGHQAP